MDRLFKKAQIYLTNLFCFNELFLLNVFVYKLIDKFNIFVQKLNNRRKKILINNKIKFDIHVTEIAYHKLMFSYC